MQNYEPHYENEKNLFAPYHIYVVESNGTDIIISKRFLIMVSNNQAINADHFYNVSATHLPQNHFSDP